MFYGCLSKRTFKNEILPKYDYVINKDSKLKKRSYFFSSSKNTPKIMELKDLKGNRFQWSFYLDSIKFNVMKGESCIYIETYINDSLINNRAFDDDTFEQDDSCIEMFN